MGGGVGVLAADGEQEGSIAVCDNVPMAEGMARNPRWGGAGVRSKASDAGLALQIKLDLITDLTVWENEGC